MDRCALFVDAGYVLADGAMAVHGTRRRESVSWDYEGLLRLLSGLATERSGLPLLRCYWYEATVEGRRSAEHDTLADLPGVKLRLAKMRPGRREGVESEIHRDLTTLARNKAVSDAMVVSAEEDLAQVVADVQDLGMRVTLLNIAVDGDWTISRALRQECDDIAEIGSAHLRPYVELISGAEPPRPDERDGAPLIALRPAVNGHGQPAETAPYPPASREPDTPGDLPLVQQGAQPAQPAQAEPLPAARAAQPVRQDAQPVQREHGAASPEPAMAPAAGYLGAPPDLAVIQPDHAHAEPPFRQEYAAARGDWFAGPAGPAGPAGQELVPRREVYGAPVAVPARSDDRAAGLPAARSRASADISGYSPGAMREQPAQDPSSSEPPRREPGRELQPVPAAPASAQVHRLPARGTGQHAAGSSPASTAPTGTGTQTGGQPAAVSPLSAQTAAPTAAHPIPEYQASVQPGIAQPGIAQTGSGPMPVPQPEFGQPTAGQPSGGQPVAPGRGMAPDAGYAATRNGNGSYTGPRPVYTAGPGAPPAPGSPATAGGPAGPPGQSAGPSGLLAPPGTPQSGSGFGNPGLPAPMGSPAGPVNGSGQQNAYSHAAGGPGGPSGPGGPGAPGAPGGPAYSGAQGGASLADAVQSAHSEGQEFGESVARDAPALWLEAVLARKPRMPSDLEARLLQGSALPIDYLLHDEVRHALRRGFWDALERARR